MRTLTLTLVAFLGLAGCLEDRSTITLKKDGSGTFTQVTTIDMTKAQEYVATLKAEARGLGLPPDEEEENPFDAIDAKKREAALKKRQGIRVLKAREVADAEKKTRTYELSVAFDSLKAMYAAGVVEDVSVKLERALEGKAWKLTIRHVFDGNDREPLTGAAADGLRKIREAMLARYKSMWGSLEVTTTLALPAKVLETNGQPRTTEEGHFVTWRIAFADLADASRLVQHVTFEAVEGLKLAPFELSAADIANAVEEAEEAAAEKKAEDVKKGADK